nr:hypothetical protein [Allobaculum sp. Allo2]
MLLIRNDKTQGFKFDPFLKERVRADHDGNFPVFQILENLFLFPDFQRAAVQSGFNAHRLQGGQMLAGKQFRRRQQRRLLAGKRTCVQAERGNHGFSAADIALHQTVHDPVPSQIRKNFV